MRDFSFLFISILLFNFIYCEVLKEIDYYAYFVQAGNIVICSERKHVSSNLILNEFENENGYTCLLNLKKNGLYRITLHVSQIEDRTSIYKDLIE